MGSISFRLTNEQDIEIKKAAKMKKESVSEYIKNKLFQPMNFSTEIKVQKQEEILNEIIELLNNLILQIKISNSLETEILKTVNPNEAKAIIHNVKKLYEKRSENNL